MFLIVKGTTPTITYTFNKVSPSDFGNAIFTIKQDNNIIIEKDLEDATIGTNTLSWTLTQQETLSIGAYRVKIMVNWLSTDGTRGTSVISTVNIQSNHINEVMV